ncbi:MAG: hypothetical protein HZB53_12265 [Chloroflexi bacterium]|nr:hypothetical protein [Chloroflexota bacterium]
MTGGQDDGRFENRIDARTALIAHAKGNGAPSVQFGGEIGVVAAIVTTPAAKTGMTTGNSNTARRYSNPVASVCSPAKPYTLVPSPTLVRAFPNGSYLRASVTALSANWHMLPKPPSAWYTQYR